MQRTSNSGLEPGFTKLELKHFSHKHALILKHEHKDGGQELSCYGCEQPIWGPYYGCIWCKFYLHKSCAELPGEMVHSIHPQHPLALLPSPPYGTAICNCAACGRRCERFFYSCSRCFFHLDTICLSSMDNIQTMKKHSSHQHPLIPLQKPASFFCDACGKEHRGASYLCPTCGFWVNQKCASLPSTIKCSNHLHPLTLAYSLPNEYYQFWPSCDICTEELNRRYWVYYCVGCRYFSHVNCATSKVEPPRDCETEVEVKDLDSNLISLPVPNESVDPMAVFIKGICQQGKYNKAAEINHFSHSHSLFFVDKQINDESCSENDFPLSTEVKKQNESCNGCAQPISAPFYRCAQCDFFLHESCAELRDELDHPCHQYHPLRLIAQQATTDYCQRYCNCCTKYCNVFMFGCMICKFYLDIQCASLPYAIRHDVHKGALTLRQTSDATCSTCNGKVGGAFVFECCACNFILCYHCALLPSKLKHKFDEHHPFTLTYSPIENHPEEYFCEKCEADLNPKRWYYHCVDCDQSLHTACTDLRPVDYFANVKFGCTLKIKKHPHNLTFVRGSKAKGKRQVSGPPCDYCSKNFKVHHAAFECVTCNFRIHYDCAFASSSEDDCSSH